MEVFDGCTETWGCLLIGNPGRGGARSEKLSKGVLLNFYKLMSAFNGNSVGCQCNIMTM